jgi:hypothetical protein
VEDIGLQGFGFGIQSYGCGVQGAACASETGLTYALRDHALVSGLGFRVLGV